MKIMKKKNSNEPEMENLFDVIKRNYNNVPGFKNLIKLLGFVIFCIIFFTVLGLSSNTDSTKKTEPVNNNTSISYKTILDNFVSHKVSFNADIMLADKNYKLQATVLNNVIDGYLDSADGITHFKVQDGIIYEVKMNSEKENEEILKGLNTNYLIPSYLINMINDVTALKTVDNDTITYSYQLDNVVLDIIVNENLITNIKVTNDFITYNIDYE